MTTVDPTRRFTVRAADYARYRPSYPSRLYDRLAASCALDRHWRIADIGCGTGLLAERFLERGNAVVGVEPNDAMREAGETSLGRFARFRSVARSAEDTGLDGRSVDMIVVGQAFHWFDADRAGTEFARILDHDGWIVLVWNERVLESEFQRQYERLVEDNAPEYRTVIASHIDAGKVARVFSGGRYLRESLPNRQQLDRRGLHGRLMSSSYAPLPGMPGHDALAAGLDDLFDRHGVDGRVTFDYETVMFYGRPGSAG
jgi:SAM-dependent methyltransferase